MRLRAMLIVGSVMLLAAPRAHAQTGCGVLGLQACATPTPTATPPAPDPGGSETTDVPVPPPEGKIFGFNSTLWQHTAIDESVLDQAVGATVQRFTVDWKSLQPTATDPPVPAYAPGAAPTGTYLYKLDGIYSRLTAAGVTPLFNFLDAPTWATDYASCGLLDTACKNAASGGMLFPNAAHIQAWKSFVGAVASRYPEAIIEPWNEPNLVNYWKPTAPDPAYMTTLQCAAYQTVKALPAPNTVTSPGLGGFSRARTDGSQMFRTYATTMYQDGLRGCMDVLSVHTYGGANGPLGAGRFLPKRCATSEASAPPLATHSRFGSRRQARNHPLRVSLGNRIGTSSCTTG